MLTNFIYITVWLSNIIIFSSITIMFVSLTWNNSKECEIILLGTKKITLKKDWAISVTMTLSVVNFNL